MSSREEFEEFASSHHYLHENGLLTVAGGDYWDFDVQTAWENWQASRQALVIELPPIWSEGANTAIGQACAQIRTADIEAIEAAGVKVKP